ncbi:transglutaminase-like cysteine peptidase [Chelatococcus sp. GCM10030263]|uniref:transglutaminase-like cysteine peptidase n=1 Tax=Chelatococcus sp. GCM10030263 TaxID=3273387 RepID=UPI00361E27AD
MSAMLRVVFTVFAAGLMAVVSNGASAQSRHAAIPNFPVIQAAVETGSARAPIGWVDFCRKNPADCQGHDGAATEVLLTAKSWRLLVNVNTRVNKAIEPISDLDHWGIVESWDYPTDGKGDCEDYVLEKRKELIKAGLPREALLVTVVRDLDDEGHAVLTVRTDRGDLVLDNKRQQILSWAATGYHFLKRQSAAGPDLWVALGAPETTTATASR